MRDAGRPNNSPRTPSPRPGVPASQARALDRRLRLDEQQRTFRGSPSLGPVEPPAALMRPAGPGPA